MLVIKLEVTWILCNLGLIVKAKADTEIPESSRSEFSERFFANSFTLSDAEDNNSSTLSRWVIADLPLLRTVLPICHKSQKSSFWGVMYSIISLP